MFALPEDAVAEAGAASAPLSKAFEIVVAGARIDGKSTQPRPGTTQADELITPPLPPENLAALSTISAVRAPCIEAIARNTVGLGVSVVPRDEEGDADNKAPGDELIRKLDALARRDTRLDRPSFLDLMFAVKTDEEECGQGFAEVSRNFTTGDIDGLFHVPGKRMRRKKDRSGWRLLPEPNDGETIVAKGGVDFYNFGEKLQYNDDGETTGDLAAGRKREVNEVIVFRLYSSESRDYGMPRDAALALEYAAEKLAAESNVSFFDSSGVPPSIIFVAGSEEGGPNGERTVVKISPQTITDIAHTVKSDGGHSKTVAVIPLPPGSKVEHVKLAQRSDRDIGNVEFRDAIDRRVRAAFRLGPIFLAGAAADDGRYDAEVQRALGLEQVFDPEQKRYEGLLDMLLDELGYKDLRLLFKRLAVESDEAKRTSANDAAQVKAITNREYRRSHGWGPLPEADTDDAEAARKEGKVPKGWNDMLVETPAGDRPFGGRNGSDQMDRKDTRGLKPGTGQRRPTPAAGGTSDDDLAKSDEVEHVETQARELEVQYLDLSEEGVMHAMKRVHTVAEVLAGEVVAHIETRDAERASA